MNIVTAYYVTRQAPSQHSGQPIRTNYNQERRYYDTPPPISTSLAVPNNDENLPPRTANRIGVSQSFDSLLNVDKVSVDTGHYGQRPYTDDEMVHQGIESKVAPATYGQGLAPRRSSTTALDYYGGGGGGGGGTGTGGGGGGTGGTQQVSQNEHEHHHTNISTMGIARASANFRSKSSSPSRVAKTGSPRQRRGSNVAQSSPRHLKKYSTWTNNIGMETKLPTRNQKKSKSMVVASPKGNNDNNEQLPITQTPYHKNTISFSDDPNDINRYHSNPEYSTTSNIAGGYIKSKRHSHSQRKKRIKKTKTAQEKSIWDMEHKSAEDVKNIQIIDISNQQKYHKKKKGNKRRKSKVAKEEIINDIDQNTFHIKSKINDNDNDNNIVTNDNHYVD